MARFQNGEWQGHHIRVWPKSFMQWLPIPWFYKLWTLPYNVGSKLRFGIELTKYPEGRGAIYLVHLPLRVVWTKTNEVKRITSMDRFNNKQRGIIEEYTVPSDGTLEIWVGDPGKGGSILLVPVTCPQ